jgi:hypothetical protein
MMPLLILLEASPGTFSLLKMQYPLRIALCNETKAFKKEGTIS